MIAQHHLDPINLRLHFTLFEVFFAEFVIVEKASERNCAKQQ